MPFDGVIIALDLASLTGVAEGQPGCAPRFFAERLRKPDDGYEETWGRAVKFMSQRISEPREIGGQLYGPGEAANAGLIRVAVEGPVFGKSGDTNHDALLITKCLWAATTGFAVARLGSMAVMRCAISTVRAHFLGKGNGRLDPARAKREAKRVCEALGWKPPNLDCADAGAVWHYAAHQWNPDATPKVDPLFLQGSAAS